VILARDGNACVYCTAAPSEDAFVLDHLVAVAKGGPNRKHNLVAACEVCNRRRGDSDPIQFLRENYRQELLTQDESSDRRTISRSRQESPPPTATQLQAAIVASRELYLSGEVPEKDENPDDERRRFRENLALDNKGCLTALLHAARQGYVEAATTAISRTRFAALAVQGPRWPRLADLAQLDRWRTWPDSPEPRCT